MPFHEQHTKGKLKIYSPANIEEYGRYQASKEYRGDIWIPVSEDELRENLGAKVFDFLGGKPVSSDEISYLERILKEDPLVQKGNISVWDEEKYEPLQTMSSLTSRNLVACFRKQLPCN